MSVNSFSLAASHPLAGVLTGDPFHGLEVGAFALSGHEAGSNLRQIGTDTALSLKLRLTGIVLSALRYDGVRPAGERANRFHRETFGATAYRGSWTAETLFERGYDSEAGFASSARSSGGLAQLRYEISPRAFAEARYEGDADSLGTFARQTVVGLGVDVGRTIRFTLEDAYVRSPSVHHVLHAVVGIGLTTSRIPATGY